jgi:hypothetical protein
LRNTTAGVGKPGADQLGRVEVERAQGFEPVDGDGQERAALVGVARMGLLDQRGEARAVQGEGGDGAGDSAAGDDGSLSHNLTIASMTMRRQPRKNP